MGYRLLHWTLILAGIPAQLLAQDSLPGQIAHLRPGQRLRVLTVSGQHLQAPLAELRTQPPGLRLEAADSTILLSAIDSLWLRHSRAGKGAWIGAVALGVPSAIFWTSFCNAVSEGLGCDAFDVVAGLTLAGAAAGAGIGALIGSASPRWELRYPAPASTTVRPQGATRFRVGLKLSLP